VYIHIKGVWGIFYCEKSKRKNGGRGEIVEDAAEQENISRGKREMIRRRKTHLLSHLCE